MARKARGLKLVAGVLGLTLATFLVVGFASPSFALGT